MWDNRFTGNKDKLYDASGPNHGTITGATWEATERGRVLAFDQSGDFVVVPTIEYGPNFAISFWFRCADLAGSYFQYLFSHGVFATQGSISTYLYEDSQAGTPRLRTYLRDDDDASDVFIDSDVDYDDGTWHHYVLSVGSGGSVVNIDGKEVGTSAQGGDVFSPTGDIYIGARQDEDADRMFYGNLDGASIFPQALSASQINALYQSQLTGGPGILAESLRGDSGARDTLKRYWVGS
jgi:hypothetical protein